MNIKLSELNNDDMLLVGENLIISKEDFVKDFYKHSGEVVYSTIKYRANINAKHMLENAIECEADNMYEDWEVDIWDDITKEDLAELQTIINKILSGSRNICYIADRRVEIDI